MSAGPSSSGMRVAVVIPCYKCRETALSVVSGIGAEVRDIYVVDDACPQQTGRHVAESSRDSRVKVLYNERNLGVGGAVVEGYRKAFAEGADIVVKVDGDGQMDPALIPALIAPIARGEADYAKGNRFVTSESVHVMPKWRLLGNAVLSFVNKLVSGYWDVMDPTNGYTAVHARVLGLLPLHRLDRGFFFESDMLARLGLVGAKVMDIPMRAVYAAEASNLVISRVLLDFPAKYARAFCKRIVYNYFLRDFNIGSLWLIGGLGLTLFGGAYGTSLWLQSLMSGQLTPTGRIMIAAIALIVGFQMLLSFLAFDVASVPRSALHPRLEALGGKALSQLERKETDR